MSRRSFLQSKDWADFQTAVGRPSVEINGRFLFEHALPVGRYLYCPHPDFANGQAWLTELAPLLAERNAWFLRVEPNTGSPDLQTVTARGVSIRPTLSLQPERTLVVPLAPDDQLFAGFKPKTRYNLRVATRHGVEVRIGTDPSELLAFLELVGKSAERAGIRTHSQSYYTQMIRMLGRAPTLGPDSLHVEIGVARYQSRPVAAALIANYQGTATYLHGGADHAARALMAPYLLHASLMRRVRDCGAHSYDLGGIAPDDAPDHPWAGITRFKRGFGGEPVDYPPAVDVVRSRALYSAYQLARRIRRGTALLP